LATGEMAFRGPDTISLLMAIATEKPEPPRRINAAVPPALSDLIMRLLAKKAADRPASAQEGVNELQALATDVTLVTSSDASTGRSGPTRMLPASERSRVEQASASKLRWLLLGAGGLLVLAAIPVAILLSNSSRDDGEHDGNPNPPVNGGEKV